MKGYFFYGILDRFLEGRCFDKIIRFIVVGYWYEESLVRERGVIVKYLEFIWNIN